MKEPGRVVVGYEGGACGADALSFAARWCRASGDTLVVATVYPGAAPIGIGRVDAEWVAYERAEAAQMLDEARALVPDDVTAEFERVDAPSAAYGLHELAEHDGTPLVILGTHRDAEMERTFPGNTGERLLSGAASPVAIVPRGYAAQPDGSLRRVTLAFVDTVDGQVALGHAVQIAAHLSGSLRIVTVVPDTSFRTTVGERAAFAHARRAEYREALDAAVARAGALVATTGELLAGPVADTLAEIGADEADLLVCGARGYGPVRRVLLGGVSSRLVRHARLPVIVLPRGDT